MDYVLILSVFGLFMLSAFWLGYKFGIREPVTQFTLNENQEVIELNEQQSVEQAEEIDTDYQRMVDTYYANI